MSLNLSFNSLINVCLSLIIYDLLLKRPAVARHPDRNLFVRRAPLPTPAGKPAGFVDYGTNFINTTYAQVQTRRNNVGSALLALEREGRLGGREGTAAGVLPAEITHPGVPYFGNSNRQKAGARRGWAVGVWSKNREEWQIVDTACHAYGLVGVSLYETLGPDVAKYM
jgi:long-chain acyl-CoA synthetase